MEYWYDIYGLLKKSELASIEAFLSHFSDRNKVEDRKRDLITLIPDIPMPDKHKLFKSRYAHLHLSSVEDFRNSGRMKAKLPAPEVVQIKTLTEGIKLGLSSKNTAFSLYIRNYTRKDIKCLILHFTLDNKIVLGISVAEKDGNGEDNFQLAQKIREEMERVVSLKASFVTFEQPPPDSEESFMKFKEIWKKGDESNKDVHRGRGISYWERERGLYYFIFRNELHRRFREVKGKAIYAPNLEDYFTLGDKYGRILNILEHHGDFLSDQKVRNLNAKDVANLYFLGYLLDETVTQNTGFDPVHVHKINIPPKTEVESIWIGHRDSASDFTTYEGLRASKVEIKETYALDNFEDIKKLADEGFFKFNDTFLHQSSMEAYEKWLVKYRQGGLYLTLMQDEELAWEASATTLLGLFGKENWPQFVSFMQAFKINQSKLHDLLSEMCRSNSWQTWQITEISNMANFSTKAYNSLLSNASASNKFELFQELFSKVETQASLPYLIKEIKDRIEKRQDSETLKFINFYLQKIEKQYSIFCDYPLILTLAALDNQPDLLKRVLNLLPKENWRSKQLLNIALATENNYILENLPLTQEEIDQIWQEEKDFLQATQEDPKQLIKRATREGKYFQVSNLVSGLAPNDLITPMLDASKEGMIGIVKVLIEQGKASADGWFNFPIKFANKGGFKRLKQYLLSKGVKDEVFQ